METKHTKGEWFACCAKSNPHFLFAKQGEVAICTFTRKQDDGTEIPIEEMQANAKLIAAAPELLDALIDLTNQIKNEHCSEFMDEPFDKAINAINKATK